MNDGFITNLIGRRVVVKDMMTDKEYNGEIVLVRFYSGVVDFLVKDMVGFLKWTNTANTKIL